MQIEYRRAVDLTPYENNSRTHSKEQVGQIVESIKEFGFTNPILIDEAGGIIAGHGRLEAANALGMEEVPTITLTGLSEAQKRAYVIADNRLALNAGWDVGSLISELEWLMESDFMVSLTGFSDDEISALVQNEVAPLDALPELPDGEKADREQMTFALTGEQAEAVKEAVRRSKALGPFGNTGNENSNGNAIARIAETFLTTVGPNE